MTRVNMHAQYEAREGVIIEWPLNGQYHDVGIDVLTSRTDVRGFAENVNDDVQMLVALKCQHINV